MKMIINRVFLIANKFRMIILLLITISPTLVLGKPVKSINDYQYKDDKLKIEVECIFKQKAKDDGIAFIYIVKIENLTNTIVDIFISYVYESPAANIKQEKMYSGDKYDGTYVFYGPFYYLSETGLLAYNENNKLLAIETTTNTPRSLSFRIKPKSIKRYFRIGIVPTYYQKYIKDPLILEIHGHKIPGESWHPWVGPAMITVPMNSIKELDGIFNIDDWDPDKRKDCE